MSAPSSALESPTSPRKAVRTRTESENEAEQEEGLSLAELRNQLLRLEETIIFALIERACFKVNPWVPAVGPRQGKGKESERDRGESEGGGNEAGRTHCKRKEERNRERMEDSEREMADHCGAVCVTEAQQ